MNANPIEARTRRGRSARQAVLTKLKKRTTPTKRQKQAQATKDLLIQTAYVLFNKYGFESVGVRDIAEASGVSTGTFYHYFASKDDIVWGHVLDEDEWFAIMYEKLDDSLSPYEKIVEFCAECVGEVINNDGSEMAFLLLKQKETSQSLYDIILKLVEEGLKNGELTREKSAPELCDFVLASYRGAVFDWYRRDGKTNVKQAIREHVSYGLEHFLAARPS